MDQQDNTFKRGGSDSFEMTPSAYFTPAPTSVEPVLPAPKPGPEASTTQCGREAPNPTRKSQTDVTTYQAEAPTASTTRTRVSQACDQCHKRKTKCDFSLPCKSCVDARIHCTKTRTPLTRGPVHKDLQRLRERFSVRTSQLEQLDYAKSPRVMTDYKGEANTPDHQVREAITSQSFFGASLSAAADDLSLRSNSAFTSLQCETILNLVRQGYWPIEVLHAYSATSYCTNNDGGE